MSAITKKVEPPPYNLKASSQKIKTVITEVQNEILGTSMKYTSDTATILTKQLSDSIKNRLRDLALPRYKFIVQVVLGEQRTEGVHVGCRCLWDSETDNYASVTYSNDEFFCVTTAYGVYQY